MAFEDTFRSIKVKDRVKATTVEATTITATTITATTLEPYASYTATATNTNNSGFIGLNHATTPILISVPAPGAAGKMLIIQDTSASGTAAHVVTATGSTFDGTNNTATFNAPGEQLILFSVSATAWVVVLNSGSVGLSSV
jgi:hypothetical protein